MKALYNSVSIPRAGVGSVHLSPQGNSMTTATADTRFLRRVLVFLIAATLASGAIMAYAATGLIH